MLSADIIKCIRDSIDARAHAARSDPGQNLGRSTSDFALHGAGVASSRALLARATIGGDELAERAAIIWAQIQRCHKALGSPGDAMLDYELQQQLREHLARQTDVVLALVDHKGKPSNGPKSQTLARAPVIKRRDELFNKFSNDVRLYVVGATQGQKTEPATFSFLRPRRRRPDWRPRDRSHSHPHRCCCKPTHGRGSREATRGSPAEHRHDG